MTDDQGKFKETLNSLNEPDEKPSEGREGPPAEQQEATSSETTEAAQKRPLEPHERGKKNRPGMKQIVGVVPAAVRADVFYYLKQETEEGAPTNMGDLIEELLKEWLEKKKGNKTAT